MSIRKIAVGAKRRLQWELLRYDNAVGSVSGRSSVDLNSDDVAYVLPADAPGGVGDDAMVAGTIRGISELNSRRNVLVLAPEAFERDTPFGEGAESLAALNQWRSPAKEVRRFKFGGELIVLGADILDGHYSYVDAVKRIRMARYAIDSGRSARIVGFSINAYPHPKVIDEFNRLDGRVPLFLRDPVSYERARKLIKGDIRLSADVAFMLERGASSFTARVKKFVDSERKNGRCIVGINMHSLFAKSSGGEIVEKLNTALSRVVEEFKDCAFVLIPHDFRSFVDDRAPLRSIYSKLSSGAKERAFLVDEPIRAKEIKEICSFLDGVFTGRMHLAIAALGCGVPIFGIVYQGKFEGLLHHFELGSDCVAEPALVSDPNVMLNKFGKWLSDLPLLKSTVEARFKYVRNLSLSNLE